MTSSTDFLLLYFICELIFKMKKFFFFINLNYIEKRKSYLDHKFCLQIPVDMYK